MSLPSFDDFVMALPMPALVVGASGYIVSANRAADVVIGTANAGRHYVTALRQPDLLDVIDKVMRDQVPRNVRYRASDVTINRFFDVHVSVLGADGAHYLLCLEDVTALQGAQTVRRDFVANVSHELRTPLTAILGFIETLRGPARGDQNASDRFLGMMDQEAERMNRLIQDLLSLSRVEQNERMRPTAPVEVMSLLASVQHRFAGQAGQSDTAIINHWEGGPIEVTGDPDQLMQVFSNLIENAVKYGGGEVHVDVSYTEHEPVLRGSAVTIAIRDNGEGIDPLDIPRLTERFYRVDTHRARTQGGTGLGLAIVKHIVSRHRGRLRITSTLGQGSVFAVTLPIHTQSAAIVT